MSTMSPGKSGNALEKGKIVLDSLTFDKYSELCSMLAEKLGMKISGRELSKEMLLLKGTVKGRECTALCTLPGVSAGGRGVSAAAKAIEKAGGVVIILSHEHIAMEAGNGNVMAVVTGDDFTRMASRTSVFNDELQNMNAPERMSPGLIEEKRRYSDMLRYARQRYDAGDLDEAASTVNLLLTIRPGADELHRLRGNILLKKGKTADAAAAFSEAVRYGPTNTENLAGRAEALYRLGDYTGELECYDRILKLNPSHRTALQNRGAALQQSGRLAEAVVAYEAAISKFGRDPGILRNLSLAHYNLHYTAKALDALDAILSANPSDERAIRLKGLILAEMGSDAALDYLERYNAIREEADVLGVIAALYNRKGRRKEAGAYAERALKLDPGNRIALKQFDEAQKTDVAAVPPQTVQSIQEAWTEPEKKQERGVAAVIASHLTEQPRAHDSVAVRSVLDAEQIADIVEKEFRSPEAIYDALRLLQAIGTQQANGAIDILLDRIMRRDGYRPDTGIMKIAEGRAFEKGDFSRSAELGRKIIAEGNDREAACRLLSSLIERYAFDDAKTLVEELDGPIGLDLRAALLAMDGRTGKAMRLLSGRKGNSTSAGDNNAGALIMMREGTGEAVNHYTTLQERSAAGGINRAVALYLRGDRALASELLSREPARMWQHPFNLGYMFLENGKTEEAIGELTRAAAMGRDADALNVLGVALAHAGKNNEAKKRFEEALSIDGRHREAKRNLRHIERVLRH
ncbi:MAG: tetratricopeptide repeat protein [Methanomassiliicoccales archaeon]|nr:tetratricopeptide repeat protein [Methanomassiliicoccales archaeon]